MNKILRNEWGETLLLFGFLLLTMFSWQQHWIKAYLKFQRCNYLLLRTLQTLIPALLEKKSYKINKSSPSFINMLHLKVFHVFLPFVAKYNFIIWFLRGIMQSWGIKYLSYPWMWPNTTIQVTTYIDNIGDRWSQG